MKAKNNLENKKVRSNLISIFLINTVVLFTLSLIGFIYLKSSSVESYFKENILVNVYLKNETKEFENKQLIKFLNLNDDVKEITYLAKEDAAEIFSKEIGEEFVGFLGYNPLLDAISVQLYSDKIDIYSIENFIKNLNNFDFIEEVEYDKPLVDALNKNFEKIGLWIFILSIVFFITSLITALASEARACSAICLCISGNMEALRDVGLHRLFGDMTTIKELKLTMGDAVHFVFRDVYVYFAVVVNNDDGARMGEFDSETSMSKIFHHMVENGCNELAIQCLPLSHCNATWTFFETGCNAASTERISITTHHGDLKTVSRRSFVSQFGGAVRWKTMRRLWTAYASWIHD